MKRIVSIGLLSAAALIHSTANATCAPTIYPPCVPSTNTRCNVAMPLDLIDGLADTIYYHPFNGAGVDIYIVDDGIDPNAAEVQAEFGQRFEEAANFSSAPDDTGGTTPHGFDMAKSAAGAISGVASGANVRLVRVNFGTGDPSNTSLKNALRWLKGGPSGQGATPLQPRSVVSISLTRSFDPTVNTLISELVLLGFPVFVSAGNDGSDVINYSPASEPGAFTVSAGDSCDGRAYWANYGSRVDGFVYAPHTEHGGTSQATALAAGVAALVWQQFPEKTGSEVVQEMINRAETGAMPVSTLNGSPNRIVTSVPVPTSPPFFGIRNKLCGGINSLQWLDSGPAIVRYELESSANSQFTAPFSEYKGLNQAHTVNVGSTTYYRVRACNTRGCSAYTNANNPATYTTATSGCP